VLVSTVVYYTEYEAQPDKFSSIPATMWWGIVTLTTVGYGDISPITPLGKLAAGIASILGIGLVALPAGILGSAFMQELTEAHKEEAAAEEAAAASESAGPRRCPHCGKVI
jgi:voltage-gated potassium channel